MKKIILSMIGISFLFLSCNRELIEFQEDNSFSFSTSSAQVTATCEPDLEALELSLPETVTVNTVASPCVEGEGSFLTVDIPDGSLASVGNPGWCADLDGSIGYSTYTFDVYSSYEDLSGLLNNNGNLLFENAANFDKVNWILNQSFIGEESPNGGFYTYGHIQWAIWQLIEGAGNNCTDDCDFLSCNPINQWYDDVLNNERLGLEIVAAAEAGEGFIPQCGQKIAIVLASASVQSLIITTDVPEKEVKCDECEGNVTELKLQYNGTEEAYIIVETKDEDVNGSKIVFEGTVAPGGMFTINGNDEYGTFGEEIKVYVDGDYVKIKTDCSESIGPGLIVEDIEVISGMSLYGGELCPYRVVECDTAFAIGNSTDDSICFIDDNDYDFDRWGWRIGPLSEGEYSYDVYAGAGQCDISKGELVGTVSVNYSGGNVEVDYFITDGYELNETHVYAGNDKYPTDKKGKATVAPGKYTIQDDLTGDIYVIAHAVVCN